MSAGDERRALRGVRREPPPFRRVAVEGIGELSPRLVRVGFAGESLQGFAIEQPAASVRLLLPSPGAAGLEVPTWNGNEFLLADGQRPIIRTFTPRHFDAAELRLDLDIVIHDGGAASSWVESARRGDAAAISGPGRGYAIDGGASAMLLAGDETALPAICQLIEYIPPEMAVRAMIEIVHDDAEIALPAHPRLTAHWLVLDACDAPGAALIAAVRTAPIPDGTRVWAAGEAAAMHQVRRHLFEERMLGRSDATVRGYWKHGR